MKKFITLFSAALLSGQVMADPLEWTYIQDFTLDGNVTNSFETIMVGKIHDNQFHMSKQNDPDVSNTVGFIEPTNVNEIGSGAIPRITMTTGSAQASYKFLGARTDTNQYQGVWYDNAGNSGDWLLKPVHTIPTPTNDLPVSSITASTEYSATYGAAKAIDGVLGNNSANVWFSNVNDANPSVTLDMGSSIFVSHYQWSRGYCTSQGWLPGSWTVQGSNDNSTWTTIDTVLDEQADNYPNTSCHSFPVMEAISTPDNYRYYKINFSASSQSTLLGVAVAEIKLWN